MVLQVMQDLYHQQYPAVMLEKHIQACKAAAAVSIGQFLQLRQPKMNPK